MNPTAPLPSDNATTAPIATRRARPTSADILGRSPADLAKQAPAKWRWHHRALLALQRRLLQDRGDLLKVAAQPLEPHSLDEADSATDEFDHDLALSELSAEQDALYEVAEALARIRNGTYGVCEVSAQTIPAERLKAIPWTRFTREVAERLEPAGIAPAARVHPAATVRNHDEIRLVPETELEAEEEAEAVEDTSASAPDDEPLLAAFAPLPPPRPGGSAASDMTSGSGQDA